MDNDSNIVFRTTAMRRIIENGNIYISVSDLLGNLNMLRMEIAEKSEQEEFAFAVAAMLRSVDSIIFLLNRADYEDREEFG